MIGDFFKAEDTFLKTEVFNKEEKDTKNADVMLKTLEAFLESKKESQNSELFKTLKKMTSLTEEVQELNETLKKEMGPYKEIKEACKTIIWTIEFIEQYSI